MKRKVIADYVTANYYCSKCEYIVTEVPIQESIYNGPPMCLNCDEQMSLDEVYIES